MNDQSVESQAIAQVNPVQDEAELAAKLDAYEPLVLRGLNQQHALTRAFAQATLSAQINTAKSLFGDNTVCYSTLPSEQRGELGIGGDLRPTFTLNEHCESAANFLDVVARLAEEPGGACAYAPSLPIEQYPAFRDQLAAQATLADRSLWNQLLWVGSGKHTVGLHYDEMLNLICQIAGEKRVTLFPPSALPDMYPAPLHRKVGGVPRSLVKLLQPDFDQFPRFAQALAKARQVTLKPGDVLYVPPLWWHHVESFGFNVMANAWYSDRRSDNEHAYPSANELLRKAMSKRAKALPPQDTQRFEMAINPLVPYWRDWLQLQYQYYVTQEYGDPYPTLPGALMDFAKHERKRRLKQKKLLNMPLRFARHLRQWLGASR